MGRGQWRAADRQQGGRQRGKLASPSLLQTYDTERRGHANEVIRDARWVQHFLKRHEGLRKVLWGLLYIEALRSISALASKQADKLVTDYGKSPLSSITPRSSFKRRTRRKSSPISPNM
jgi:hypothetical protein